MPNNKRKMTPEEFKERRRKELAILKAENEMLEDAKNHLISMSEEDIDPNKYSDTPKLTKNQKIEVIEAAQEENLEAGRSFYGASKEEIENSEYGKPDKASIKAYEKRLKLRHMTDEQMRNKKADNVIYDDEQNKQTDDGLIEDYTGKGGKINRNRRKRRTNKTNGINETNEYEEKTPTITKEPDKRIEIAKPEKVEIKTKEDADKEKVSIVDESYDFDVSSIPDYVQYDMIPLPSGGQCYSHKKSRIPVAYLTGADENIIASPNMYRDGKLIDILLKRKILDKSINVDELCSGDRDAIAWWLRLEAYGPNFPITVRNPNNGKVYNREIDLSKFKPKDFTLKGDENGYFDYEIGKNKIKFKFLTKNEEDKLRDSLIGQISDSNKVTVLRDISSIQEAMKRISVNVEDLNDIQEDIDEIANIIGDPSDGKNTEDIIPNTITDQMVAHTVSVNGHTEEEYIRRFIDNMRAGDAMKYRNYFTENTPGMDFKMKIQADKSDGGGSFTTFLRIDDSIFITY